jgi:hypothetical protein
MFANMRTNKLIEKRFNRCILSKGRVIGVMNYTLDTCKYGYILLVNTKCCKLM